MGKFCTHCGAPMENHHIFCVKCGQPAANTPQSVNTSPNLNNNHFGGLVAAKCTQCGSNINVDPTHDAGICPSCGTPFITEKVINNFVSNHTYYINNAVMVANANTDNRVRIAFDDAPQSQIFNLKCFVYDKATYALLGECRRGETVFLNISSPLTVTVKMSSQFCTADATVYPGHKYRVRKTTMGVRLVETD